MLSTLKSAVVSFFKFCRGVLSEPEGNPSSTRTLMYIFSFFSMWLIWRCFYHIMRITDQAMVSIWLSNMPLLITTLMGLIALPYAVNKSTTTMSDIANMIANARQNKVETTITGSFSRNGMAPTPAAAAPAIVNISTNPATVNTPAFIEGVGTPGQKG